MEVADLIKLIAPGRGQCCHYPAPCSALHIETLSETTASWPTTAEKGGRSAPSDRASEGDEVVREVAQPELGGGLGDDVALHLDEAHAAITLRPAMLCMGNRE
jgi:hypothetical protein